MGLERVAAVLQGVISNYDTDLFVPLLKRAAELCGVDYEKEIESEAGRGGAASLRVIADHARATTFLITDGVLPSNEGRGYVLRKIMRRAIFHARLLGTTRPFLDEMAQTVRQLMGNAYPELVEPNATLRIAIITEERRFGRTLDEGLKKLQATPALAPMDRNIDHGASVSQTRQPRFQQETGSSLPLSGVEAFKLYDT
jgi:alanyl-tRNA synthetase